jgi:murein DD-endopeptidase MepM/ murein hydrolase activator NlpD
MFGIPAKTLMKDFKGITSWLGINVLAADEESLMDSVAEKMGYKPIEKTTESKWFDYERNPLKVTDGSTFDKVLNHFGWNLTEREKEQIAADEAAKAQAAKADEIAGKVADLSGEAKDKKVWSYVTSYMKGENGDKPLADVIQDGDYKKVQEYRDMYVAAGGNTDYFDERIFAASKSAMKKTIVYDPTNAQIEAQQNIKDYLLENGMTDYELSEMAYKSNTAKDMKIAFMINDKDAMLETLEPLVRAGLSYEDLERIWDNRNRIDVMKYKSSKGRYADRLKSTGKYIWPTSGQITSYFGYRNAPTRGASSNHPAIDIGAPMGTEVVASDGGVVISAGWNGGYGNSVGIKHDNGMVTYYNHLSAWNVKEGDTVAQGQPIANVGSTGVSTGPHLDFKILDSNGKPVDPLKYLASRS